MVIASNRLPITVVAADGDLSLIPSAGGLATGLASLLTTPSTLWVGWHGLTDVLADEQQANLDDDLRRRRLHPVALSQAVFNGYYNEVANGALWPLYHYQAERMPLELSGWSQYRDVNAMFADELAAIYRPGDLVWIHDYHLQLVPALLRERVPQARIGFFLHIPFPSSEIFRILPWREEILKGLLGADVIGFHTHAYARHFRSALLRILGIDAYADNLAVDGRTVKIGAFPLGVDVSQIAATVDGGGCELTNALEGLRAEGRVKHLMLAIDRLDYTKGLPRRLLSVERLLENHPDLRGAVVLVQIAAPSRDDVPAYETYRRDVEGLVGRINGRFGMPGYQPIQYVSRGFTHEQVLALYRHVDVMVVTPLRDGMNLVAKEFVAARDDLDGVLVLSEFAGAAAELGEALQVNPYDIDDTAAGLKLAIDMSIQERRARMKALRNRVVQFDASEWVRKFVEFFHDGGAALEPHTYLKPAELLERIPKANPLVLFLDYDGTLFPIVRIPQLAAPDKPLLALLRHLATNAAIEIHIVSGRSSAVLSEWFDGTPIHLHAEHGAMSRLGGEASSWTSAVTRGVGSDWQSYVKSVLEDFKKNAPGSFIEEKAHSVAWHYRMADPIQAERAANELRLHGRETFAPMGLELIAGKKVVEIRHMGINKGTIVASAMGRAPAEAFAVAIGDDMTDEDMFAAVPANGLSVAVGDHTTKAQYRLRDPAAVRRLLELLAMPRREIA